MFVFDEVGHGDWDLGVTAISYNHERGSFIDFTFQVGLDGTVWVSRPPQPLPPIRNISLIFDIPSWILIIVSVLVVTVTLIIIVNFNNAGLSSSVRLTDVAFISLRDSLVLNEYLFSLFVCIRMLNSESFPKWFRRGPARLSGLITLLTWSLANMMLMFAFVSMLRAAMMRPVSEKPIDTTRDLVESGKTPMMTFGTFWADFMKTSENYWHRQVELMVLLSSRNLVMLML